MSHDFVSTLSLNIYHVIEKENIYLKEKNKNVTVKNLIIQKLMDINTYTLPETPKNYILFDKY